MTYGPIQLVVIGFGQAALPLDLVDQLRQARKDGVVRIISATFIAKDDHGDVEVIKHTDLTDEERTELGLIAGALLGLGADGQEGAVLGGEIGALAAEQGEFGLTPDELLEIADRIPFGGSALMLLFEHVWAIGLKEAVHDAHGIVLAQGFITPESLVALGAELADNMAEISTGAD